MAILQEITKTLNEFMVYNFIPYVLIIISRVV